MVTKCSRFAALTTLLWFVPLTHAAAQDSALQANRQPATAHLLDRGVTADTLVQPQPEGNMTTLAVGAGTPGITSVGVISAAPAPGFLGNFYTAPTDFPSSWYPFSVTGVFAYQTMAPGPPANLILGAGVAQGPFPGTMGTMWNAFGTATVPVPMFMTPSIIGAPGNLSSPLMVPNATLSLGVACGLFTRPLGAGGGPGLGGVASATNPRRLHSFNGPPVGADSLTAHPYSALIDFAAGCFVSGATVPVELQAFSID